MSERQELLIAEERVTFTDGGVHWFSTIKVPLLNEDGTCDKVLGVASDITERKRVEEALRQSEEHYRTVMETIPQMVWTIQPDGIHDFCNHHWHDYTGLSLAQTINSGWVLVVHPDDAPEAVAAWRQAFEAGESFEGESRLGEESVIRPSSASATRAWVSRRRCCPMSLSFSHRPTSRWRARAAGSALV